MTQEVAVSLTDLLTDEHRALVERGIYTIHPGAAYPVLRWAAGPNLGAYAPGSGIPVNHNDIGQIGRQTAYKRTAEYQELMRKYLPADLDDTKKGTLGWILKQGMEAIEGATVSKKVTCNQCGHEQNVGMYRRPDGNVLVKIVELLVGRAAEQRDVNINSEAMYHIIDERRAMRDLVVYEVSPTEREEREVLAGEWKDSEV